MIGFARTVIKFGFFVPKIYKYIILSIEPRFYNDREATVRKWFSQLRARLDYLTKPSDISHLTKLSWSKLQETGFFA